MNIETRAIKGHFGFDSKRVLRVSIESKFEIELAIEHDDHTTFIALDPSDAAELRDVLSMWLEGRRPPLAAARH